MLKGIKIEKVRYPVLVSKSTLQLYPTYWYILAHSRMFWHIFLFKMVIESQDGNKESQDGDQESQDGDKESQDGDKESQDGDKVSQDGDKESQDGDWHTVL